MKKILLFTFLFLIFPAISFAEISEIVFVTDPQTIKPDNLSGPIKIQFKNSVGGVDSFGEKSELLLTSTSVSSGEKFFNDSSEPVSTTINSNWTSRTFYYKDSAEGTFTITASIVGTSLTVTQQITISSGAPPSNNPDSSGEVLSANTASSGSSSQPSGGSTTNVSSLNAQLEILAGNDRTTSPGSPIWFQATVKKNTTGTGSELNWSYGDGNVGVGPLVSHTYKYPGDYVVVLSARAGDIFSVSRLKVKVIEPDISVSDKGGYLEIANNSNAEINLFNWKIENNGKGFVFQPNTIILPHSIIKLDKVLLTMKGYDNSLDTCLENALGEEIFAVAPIKEVDLSEAAKNLEIIKKEALSIQNKIPNIKIKTDKIESNLANFAQISTGTEDIIYEAPKRQGFISKLTNFIKGVFSR